MFLCVTLKLFSLSFMPLLAPNPGEATDDTMTEQRCQTLLGLCSSPEVDYRTEEEDSA